MARKQTPTQQAHMLAFYVIDQFMDGGGPDAWLEERGYPPARAKAVTAQLQRILDSHYDRSGERPGGETR
jgi:hypothetical protein